MQISEFLSYPQVTFATTSRERERLMDPEIAAVRRDVVSDLRRLEASLRQAESSLSNEVNRLKSRIEQLEYEVNKLKKN